MNNSFTIQIKYAPVAGFTYGASIASNTVTVTGPSNPPAQTVGADVQYVTFGPGMLAGTYSYSIQAKDATGANLGSPAVGSLVYTPVPNIVLSLPEIAKPQGTAGNGNGYVQLRLIYANLGSFAAGTVPDHTTITLTGATNTALTIPAGQQTALFGPGLAVGDYSYSMQTYDAVNNPLGPSMTGRFYLYYEQTQTLPIPASARIVVTA